MIVCATACRPVCPPMLAIAPPKQSTTPSIIVICNMNQEKLFNLNSSQKSCEHRPQSLSFDRKIIKWTADENWNCSKIGLKWSKCDETRWSTESEAQLKIYCQIIWIDISREEEKKNLLNYSLDLIRNSTARFPCLRCLKSKTNAAQMRTVQKIAEINQTETFALLFCRREFPAK